MKPHYPLLDGLRGVAAFVVLTVHLMDAVLLEPANHPIPHGSLAVDFFYLLSGFVIGYAYDDRWATMSIISFFKIRLIRLHPLVILGVALGTLFFWVDPYNYALSNTTLFKLVITMLISFTLFPSPDLRGYGETHCLNGPCWSLLQEYIANVLYALFGRKLSIIWLAILVGISGVALILTAHRNGNLSSGWDYPRFWVGSLRMMFSFFAGLLLFRSGKLIKVPMAFIVCSITLICLFIVPVSKYNGLYEAACVIIAFPLIVATGAGGVVTGRWAIICNYSGALSYPIYILHYPFLSIYVNWIRVNHPTDGYIAIVAILLFFFFIILATVALKYYDEPTRRFLKARYLIRNMFNLLTKKSTNIGIE